MTTTQANAPDRDPLLSPDGYSGAANPPPSPPEPDEPTAQEIAAAQEQAARVWDSVAHSIAPLLNVLRQPQWLSVLIPFAIVFLYSTVWLCRKEWFYLGSSLLFQPFVPILALILLWSRRLPILRQYYELAFVFPENSPKRRGKMWMAILGAVLMVGAAIVGMPGTGLLGLIIAIAGAVYYLFGPFVLRTVWQPLALLLLMIPVPADLMVFFTVKLERGVAYLTGLFFQQVIKGAEFRAPITVHLPSHDLEVTGALCGIGVVVPTLVLALWLCLLRRVPVLVSLMIIVVALLTAVLANTLRLVALGLFTVETPAPWLIELTTWLLVAVSFFVVMRVADRLLMSRRTSTADLEAHDEPEDDVDADLDAILRSEREKLAGTSETSGFAESGGREGEDR